MINSGTTHHHTQETPSQAFLTAIHGPLKGQKFLVDQSGFILGSGAEAEVQLSGGGVSPRHAGLHWRNGSWEVVDLTGEMFPVNDIPTVSRVLGGGEIFKIGEHELHFTIATAETENFDQSSPAELETILLIELEKGKTLDGVDRVEIVAGPGYTVGRTPENDLAIRDPLASRRHCRIEVIGGEAVLTDLGSLNGTHLEGRPIQQATLRPGDLIVAGKTALRCLRP